MRPIPCNLCGADDAVRLFTAKDRLLRIDETGFPVVRCRRCGLVYLNPQPSAEELQCYYPESYSPYQDDDGLFAFGPVWKRLRGLMDRWRTKRPGTAAKTVDASVKRHLDYGCGGGVELEKTRSLHPGWELYGLDVNETACRRTEAKGFRVFRDADGAALPEAFFDSISMSHVLEHVPDPSSTLRRVRAALKPDGLLIVAVPNFGSFAAMIFRSYWYALEAPRHLFQFTPKTLGLLLERSGFRVEERSFNPGPKVAIRSWYHLIGRRSMRSHPLIWKFWGPFSAFAASIGKSSIMTFRAKKA